MQGLADGYFVAPYTVAHYLAQGKPAELSSDHAEVKAAVISVRDRIKKLMATKGKRSPTSFHRELGLVLWDECGMGRNAKGLGRALARIPELRQEFHESVRVTGSEASLNQELERALRVADLLELGELVVRDALERAESCGGHFREESQTADGEAKRDDERYTYVAAWEHRGDDAEPLVHQERLEFEHVKPVQRSYK